MQENIKYWVWLSMLVNIIPRKRYQLLCHFKKPENIWDAEEHELRSLGYANADVIRNIFDKDIRSSVDAMLGKINTCGLEIITLDNVRYPELLKKIADPPVLLYSKGNFDKDMICMAVVGSRKATAYGYNAAEALSACLARYGFNVVSGMARGIDSCAHLGALKTGGKTTAILGCGLDIIYPPENSGLMEKIIKNGAVISEFPPGTIPIPRNFPARNRIISGLSRGVIVIEAAEKSGSLITAGFALEQGREVFALPGNISSTNSVGTNKLIRDGAKIVTCIEDILEELNINICENININTGNKNKRTACLNNLSGQEREVAEALQEDMHIDRLSSKTGIEMKKVNAILVMLELRGIVEQLPGKIFRLK